MDLDLKFHKQSASAIKNVTLGLIKKSFALLDHSTLTPLYTSLVRPHFFKKDAKLVEKVQRRATMLVSDIKSLSYEDRLRSLNLPSFQYRRRRGDMVIPRTITPRSLNPIAYT